MKFYFFWYGVDHACYIRHGNKDCQMKTKDGTQKHLLRTSFCNGVNGFYIQTIFFTLVYIILRLHTKCKCFFQERDSQEKMFSWVKIVAARAADMVWGFKTSNMR